MKELLSDALALADLPAAVIEYLSKNGFAPRTLTAFSVGGPVTRFELGDIYPVVYLRGMLAPPGTQVLVLCFTGTRWDADVESSIREPATVVEVLTSDGVSKSFVGTEGGVHQFEGPEGLVPDAMARVLGLATPPAAFDTARLWLFVWMTELLRMEATTDEAGILIAHPAIEAEDLAAAMEDPFEFVAERHRDLVSVADWGAIFGDATVGRFLVPGLSIVPYAPWYDEGSFARAVMAEIEEPLRTIEELEPALFGVVTSLIAS